MAKQEHGRGGGAAELPLTPPETKAPSHAERARTLLASHTTGTLGTIAKDPAGYPYGSFITHALDGPDPVFLISRLAAHTQHLEGDPRASLLVQETHADDPLANGRVTLVGDCTKLEGDDAAGARAAFLSVHPKASYYVDFSDFAFWKLGVASIRYIGGYGRMSWIDAETWRDAEPDPLGADAAGILEHMNDDHAEALVAYARAFTRASSAEHAVMTGVDRYGFEMSVTTERGPRPARLAFPSPVETSTEVRKALVRMVGEARAKLGTS